ncbi:hypothetical protein Tco_0735776 [Tanacetum coccineum]
MTSHLRPKRDNGITLYKYDGAYEINHEHNKSKELCEVHEQSVCNIRICMMIKYSFNDDEEYVAVKEDEYDDLTVTRKKACRAYQEIFQIMNEGWMDLEKEISTKLVECIFSGILWVKFGLMAKEALQFISLLQRKSLVVFFDYLHYDLPEDFVSIIIGIILELQHDDLPLAINSGVVSPLATRKVHVHAMNGFDMPLPVAVCSGLVNPLAPRKAINGFEKSLPRAVCSWTSQSLCLLDMVD